MRALMPLPSWLSLLQFTELELAQQDITIVNLACSVGLPGAACADPVGCLRCLDNWAALARQLTDDTIESDFRRSPSDFNHSEPLFRMTTLICMLQRRCGVRYNPDRIDVKPDDPFYAGDQFIFGAIQGPGGTCASLPVVFTAVARRLGYPVRLVYTHSHVFCRWDDPDTGERVNIEGSKNLGINSHPDDYYRTWPHPFDANTEEYFGFLRSLTPRGELAEFLLQRTAVCESAGLFRDAVEAAAGAVAAEPDCGRPWFRLRVAARRWGSKLRERGLIGDMFRHPSEPQGPRRWPHIPWHWEAEIMALDTAERRGVPALAYVWDDGKPR